MTIHSQTNSSGDISVTPLSNYHVEKMILTGTTTSRDVLIDLTFNPLPGILEAKLTLPLTAGITFRFLNSADRSLAASYTTDGVQPNALFRFVVDRYVDNGSIDLLSQTIPAFI